MSKPDYVVTTDSHLRLVTNINWVVANEVSFADAGRWTQWADGGGSSLELTDPNCDNRLVANWVDSDETGKSQWVGISYSDWLDWSYPRTGSGGQAINSVAAHAPGRRRSAY